MRHKKNTSKFKRTEEERKRLWIDLSSAIIKSGKVVTFTTRAKWFRPKFERLVTLVKRAGDDQVKALRSVRPYLSETDAKKLVTDIAPKFNQRPGGYTRQYKLSADFDTQDKSIVLLSE
jgi:large subunit ribosomal protein L17